MTAKLLEFNNMQTNKLIEVFGAVLERSLYEDSNMKADVVEHLVNLYKVSAKQNQKPKETFAEVLEFYGNCNVAEAVEEVKGLMQDSLLYQELKKHNADRANFIDVNPATRLKRHVEQINKNISMMAVTVDGKDVAPEIKEKSFQKVPAIFKPKEEAKASGGLQKLDIEYRYHQI
jgi:hypothetical protein